MNLLLSIVKFFMVIVMSAFFGMWMKNMEAALFCFFASLWAEELIDRSGLQNVKKQRNENG